MKHIIVFILLLSIHCTLFCQVKVRGYYRKDGTYVRPHYRSSPNSTKLDNWSTKGNVNPYTGKVGTKNVWNESRVSSYRNSNSERASKQRGNLGNNVKKKRIPFPKLNETLIAPIEEILSGKVKFGKLDDFINKRIYHVKVEERNISEDNSYKITYKCISDNFDKINVTGRDWRNPHGNYTFILYLKNKSVKDMIVESIRSDPDNSYIEVDLGSFRTGMWDECVFRNMKKNVFVQVFDNPAYSSICFTNYDNRKTFSSSFWILKSVYDALVQYKLPLEVEDIFSKSVYLNYPNFKGRKEEKDGNGFIYYYESSSVIISVKGHPYINNIAILCKKEELYNALLKEVVKSYLYNSDDNFYVNDNVICTPVNFRKFLIFQKR